MTKFLGIFIAIVMTISLGADFSSEKEGSVKGNIGVVQEKSATKIKDLSDSL